MRNKKKRNEVPFFVFNLYIKKKSEILSKKFATFQYFIVVTFCKRNRLEALSLSLIFSSTQSNKFELSFCELKKSRNNKEAKIK